MFLSGFCYQIQVVITTHEAYTDIFISEQWKDKPYNDIEKSKLLLVDLYKPLEKSVISN